MSHYWISSLEFAGDVVHSVLGVVPEINVADVDLVDVALDLDAVADLKVMNKKEFRNIGFLS